ncbi:MAG: restriction endonuclease subunit S [Treponema sp.]|nr:restriction endonuclease subunit S [Treponema sp.]
MEEWKEVRLEECVSLLGDGLHGTPKYTENGEYAFINGNNLINGKIVIKPETKCVNEDEYLKYKKNLTDRTIFVSINGTIGNVGTYNGEKIILGKSACYFNVLDDIDKTFIKYVVSSPLFKTYLETNATGTTIKNVSLAQMRNYSFLIPPLPTQQKIATILSSLDDKIELNNKINTNLEQQAGALFKNWFVDFEPFGGKMPEGWKEIALEELCTVVTKGTTPTTLGKKFTETGINFIKGESILENHTFDIQKISHIDEETNTMLKRSIIEPNDILFTIAGTLGRFAMIDKSLTPANTNQAVGIIRANPEIVSPYYLYSFFIGNWHNDYYTKRIQQAVQANLSLGTIKSLPIIIPDSQNLNKYTSLIEPLFKQMKQLENENIKLSTLRDTLLPKLMNEEIFTK